jgi:hypothetical protein
MAEQINTEGENNVWLIGAGMLVVGIVVGFLIGWFWQKNDFQAGINNLQNGTSTAIVSSSTVPALETIYKSVDTPAFVSVDDQRAGTLVFIKHTEVSKPTWITVREIVNGSVGNILGAEMVTSATDDVPVTVLRPTVAGQEYAVFLYQDDGDGQFDFKTDLLVMQNNAPVAAMFTAQ